MPVPALPVLPRAAGLVLTLLLVGCSAQTAPDPDRAPKPSWTPVSVPGGLGADQEMASVVGVLGRAGPLPALMVGTRTTVADGGRVATWSPREGGRSVWNQPATRADRESRAALALADGGSTWLAGTSWEVGARRQPFLLASPDRSTWVETPLPRAATKTGFAPAAGVVVAGRPLLVGTTADDRAVAVQGGADGRFVLLPAPEEGVRTSGISAVAADGDQVLAVVSAGRDGEASQNLAYLSRDAGASWEPVAPPAPERAEVAGLVRVGDRWVATGSTLADDVTSRVAAWSSTDAQAWGAEALPAREAIEQAAQWSPEAGTALGEVARDGDGAIAPAVSGDDLSGALLRRDGAGSWSLAGVTDAWDEPGVAPAVGTGDDGAVIARSGDGRAVLGSRATEELWRRDVTVGDRHEGAGSLTFPDGVGSPLIASTTVTVTGQDRGWSRSDRLDPVVLSGRDAMEASGWDPAGAEGLAGLRRATAPDGAQVLLGSRTDPVASTSLVEGWYRTGDGADWQPVTGFGDGGSDDLSSVLATAQGWVAVGAHRDTWKVSETYRPRVWTSADGVAWQQVPDEQVAPPEVDGSVGVLDACVLAGGDVLAVGYATRSGRYRPAAWRRSGDGWAFTDASSTGAQSGYLSGCAAGPGAAVVTGASGSVGAAWLVSDGSGFRPVRLGAEGDDVSSVRAVPGAMVAVGTLGGAGRAGAALWLSSDGEEWRALAVPGGAASRGSDVAVDGDDLVVTGVSTTGPRAWRLAGYQEQVSPAP